ncbi:hypothetical protein SAMN04488241_102309 [Sphingomonas rubra]|uniref:DUF4136 domain-containing protein n=2 Tax=Sphingomonas rubra TaxID=634430 RepID=A0A1I5QV63_9SPHN|nr:hypothetical protein SAMN04488241_102309 [Sphingomonas rubra]
MVAAALLAVSGFAVSGTAEAKVEVDKAFRFPAGQPAKIVVFRPDVEVGTMGMGGVQEPNAEWTATARTKLSQTLATHQKASGNEVVFLPDELGENAQLVADYQSLFRAVASAVVEHKMNPLAKLPTKKDRFDWTLGPGATQLSRVAGGDYALFLWTKDAYGSAGRKVMQAVMAGLFGAFVPAGVHASYAALVDLKTGNLVWFNVDPGSGGDPRTDEGATKRIGQLLQSFPAKEGAPAAAVAAR